MFHTGLAWSLKVGSFILYSWIIYLQNSSNSGLTVHWIYLCLGKFKEQEWFINGSYSPSKSFISHHLECFNRINGEYSKMYQNFLFLGDFSVNTNEKCMEEFCNLNELTSLIKKPTRTKNPNKPTCIELILTNQPNCFQHRNVFETGLTDFHLLTVTEFKMGFQKLPMKIVKKIK